MTVTTTATAGTSVKPRRVNPATVTTLAIDIGGTGLKASVLDRAGRMLTDRARIATTYPVTPNQMVDQLCGLVKPLPTFDRISVGFPGVVRHGRILTAPHLVTVAGPGSKPGDDLVHQWTGFAFGDALAAALGKPVRVLNDADLQGLDVMTGLGLEVIITLGTGFGTAVFADGHLGPHLELSQHRFRQGETYDDQLGDQARKQIGNRKWNKRLSQAIATLHTLFLYDHLYLGGGNTRHITITLPDNVTIIDANAGLLGGLRLWDLDPTP